GRREAVKEKQQHDGNQIGEGGCSEIEPELEAQQGYQCQRTDAEQQLRCRLREPDGLVRVQGNTGCRDGSQRWQPTTEATVGYPSSVRWRRVGSGRCVGQGLTSGDARTVRGDSPRCTR